MAVRELSEAEYQATFTPPMRRLGVAEAPPVRVSLKDYVAETIATAAIPAHADKIDIQYVYVSQDDSFTHVLFNWGARNVYLAIVVDNRSRTIHGYRVLDINALYGLK